MGRGGGGGGGGGFGGGGSFGGGGHIGGGFSGGRVGGSSHSSSGSSWGSSHSSHSGSSWGSSHSSHSGGGWSSGGGNRNYSSGGGNGLFPPLWWWIWGNNSNKNTQSYDNRKYDNGGGKEPQKKPEEPKPEKPEKKTTAVGCLSVILIIIAIILAVVMISGISAAKNAPNRKKLEEKVTVDIGYIDDQLNWFSKPATVENAMKSFYDKTGVMPYLIITNNIGGAKSESDAEEYTKNKYYELFTKNGNADEAHFLVLWYQENGSDDYAFMYAGSSANGVIDKNARDVVYNYFNRYYTSDYDDNQYFAKVFEDSATDIMRQSSTGWKATLFWLVIVIAVLVIMNVIDYKNTMKIKKQEAAAKILNANIEDPGWKDDAEDLAEKYVDEASELASKYDNK